VSERRLVSIRRMVSAERRAAYDLAWERLHGEVTDLGAHAWRFRSTTEPDLFLEFLEFKADPDPRRYPAVAAAFDDLETASPAAAAEEWVGG
jgi:hypothetical protein